MFRQRLRKDTARTEMASASSVARVYLHHVRKYPGLVATVIIATIGLQAAELGMPWYLRALFNGLASGTRTAQEVQTLIGVVWVIALIWLARWGFRRIQDFGLTYFEARVMEDLFVSAFDYLIKHSYHFFISRFAGSLTHRVTKFARAFESIYDSIIIQFFPTTLFVVGAVIVLSIRNLWLGLMLGVWVIIFLAFQVYVSRLRLPLRRVRAVADTQVTGSLADAISNHPTIMLFAGERYEQGMFSKIVEAWRTATIRSWSADAWVWSVLGILMMTIQVGLLWGATILWGRGLLTVGDFVLIQSYLLTTFDRLTSINRELRRFHDAFADASEMVYMLELPHEIQDAPGAPGLHVSNGEIRFKEVGFYFRRPQDHILSHFDLTIPGGERVALVGPSGAGKTTITRLLLRMYDVKEGIISIDDQNIARVRQESLRDAISYVPQEPILFHRSLMENIRYGRRDASDAEVLEAARQAHCHEFISQLPEQYETLVGERGVRLSGGERQRVAIARAILKGSPILVLDEATSSLDSESEALIQDALKTLMEGKTVIVIAHRLSTIMHMDRIVVLEKGKIAADGRHEELLSQGGLYHKLWSIQAGGFIGTEA